VLKYYYSLQGRLYFQQAGHYLNGHDNYSKTHVGAISINFLTSVCK